MIEVTDVIDISQLSFQLRAERRNQTCVSAKKSALVTWIFGVTSCAMRYP